MATDWRDIRSADWQPQLGGWGGYVAGLDDIAQCINTIILTPLRSCVHHPDKGCDLLPYIGMPITVARPYLVAAVTKAITKWEPRVIVRRVAVTRADASPQDPAHLDITVYYDVKLSGASGQATASVAA